MNRHVNAIAGRLSLRPPQRSSLEILDRITEIVPPRKEADVAAALSAIRSEFPTVTDFEREFPSLCFALATGVGKTWLMGAFISYLHLAYGINNFFVMTPNLTIYNKLVTDFTPEHIVQSHGVRSCNDTLVIVGRQTLQSFKRGRKKGTGCFNSRTVDCRSGKNRVGSLLTFNSKE